MGDDAPLLKAGEFLLVIQNYWWPFCRIMAIFTLAPLLNHKAFTKQARFLLALSLTIALGGALPDAPDVDPLSAQGALLTLEQIVFGLILGLAMQLVFTIFTIVGEVVATQMGMSMARLNDPVNGVASSIIYQVYFVLLAFLFFAVDGHLLTVVVLFKSFAYWPVGSGLSYFSFERMIGAISWVFSAAMMLSLPMVFCTFLVQFCFGLLNRISPTLNLFSLGFPISIIVGLLCIYFTLPGLPESYVKLTRELLDTIEQMMQGGRDV